MLDAKLEPLKQIRHDVEEKVQRISSSVDQPSRKQEINLTGTGRHSPLQLGSFAMRHRSPPTNIEPQFSDTSSVNSKVHRSDGLVEISSQISLFSGSNPGSLNGDEDSKVEIDACIKDPRMSPLPKSSSHVQKSPSESL